MAILTSEAELQRTVVRTAHANDVHVDVAVKDEDTDQNGYELASQTALKNFEVGKQNKSYSCSWRRGWWKVRDQGSSHMCGAFAIADLLRWHYVNKKIDGFSRFDYTSPRFIWLCAQERDEHFDLYRSNENIYISTYMNVVQQIGCVAERDVPMEGGLYNGDYKSLIEKAARFKVKHHLHIYGSSRGDLNFKFLRFWLEKFGPLFIRTGYQEKFPLYRTNNQNETLDEKSDYLPVKSKNGHGMLLVGYEKYDPSTGLVSDRKAMPYRYLIRNTYGQDWGADGHMWWTPKAFTECVSDIYTLLFWEDCEKLRKEFNLSDVTQLETRVSQSATYVEKNKTTRSGEEEKFKDQQKAYLFSGVADAKLYLDKHQNDLFPEIDFANFPVWDRKDLNCSLGCAASDLLQIMMHKRGDKKRPSAMMLWLASKVIQTEEMHTQYFNPGIPLVLANEENLVLDSVFQKVLRYGFYEAKDWPMFALSPVSGAEVHKMLMCRAYHLGEEFDLCKKWCDKVGPVIACIETDESFILASGVTELDQYQQRFNTSYKKEVVMISTHTNDDKLILRASRGNNWGSRGNVNISRNYFNKSIRDVCGVVIDDKLNNNSNGIQNWNH